MILYAEVIVHVVEVKLEQLDFAWRLVRVQVSDRFEIENFCKNAAFSNIRASFLQALRLILIELGVEEELGHVAHHRGHV